MNMTEAALKIIKARNTMGLSEFQDAFHNLDVAPTHLWRQYTTTYRNDFTSFMNYLNLEELKALCNYIENEVD